MKYRDKWPIYAEQCDRMQVKPDRVAEFDRMAHYALANKNIYEEASSQTKSKFPWYGIAVIHKRESDAQDKQGNPLFTSYLGNGQSLARKTTIVPIDRGPFCTSEDLQDPAKCRKAFVAGCLDALRLEKIDQQAPPWPLEKVLYWVENLNGLGYEYMGIPSPYIFGGTNIQVIGKYTRDHHYDGSVWDSQPGCAPMLYEIFRLMPDFHVLRES